MTRVVGFTSTREDFSDEQRAWTRARLEQLYEPDSEFHHGDCVGGDVEGFVIARELGYRTIAHPALYAPLRAFTRSDVVLEERPHLVRNRDVVDTCTLLVAVPNQGEIDAPRSGTWATVRYARRCGCPTRNWWYERSAR